MVKSWIFKSKWVLSHSEVLVGTKWIQATCEKDFNHQALRNPEIEFAMLTGMNWITENGMI